jgi:CheY-like chemotaxis protein
VSPSDPTLPQASSTDEPVRRKVLIVDDDPVALRALARQLRPYRVDVITHERAFGVTNLIVEHRPDLVIMDVHMPGLDGPSLVRVVREDPATADTTVVLHSGLDELTVVNAARECGADGYLLKAMSPREIHERLKKWL